MNKANNLKEGPRFLSKLMNQFSEATFPHLGKTGSFLWHYTSIEALFGIIEGKEIWLSDTRFLNDRGELTQYAEDLETIIRALVPHLHGSIVKVIPHFFGGKRSEDDIWDFDTPFIMSFSYSKDLLSQWKGYANRRGGLAIKFSVNSMWPKRDDARNGLIMNTLYSAEDKKGMVESFFFGIDQEIRKTKKVTAQMDNSIKEVIEYFLELCLTAFKAHQWREEQEARIVIGKRYEKDRIRYKVSHGRIIPYLAVKVDPRTAIKEVMLLEQDEEQLSLMTEFLSSRGLEKVKVSNSNLQIRL